MVMQRQMASFDMGDSLFHMALSCPLSGGVASATEGTTITHPPRDGDSKFV